MKEADIRAIEEMAVLKKQLSAIGMCMRAGKLLIGPDPICDSMRSFSFKKRGERVYVVIEASDTSDNTHKKLTDKCRYYDVPHVRLPIGMGELSEAVGKLRSVAAVGIVDENLYRLVLAADKNKQNKEN